MSAQPKTIESLADLSPDARNVNRGTEIGAKTIEESLRTFGAGRSIVADRNGIVIAGNKTLENAAKAGIERIRVVPTIGDELVVVQRLDLDLERDPRARGLAINDNRSSELSYSPDDALLAQMLTELAEQDKATAQATGYDDAAIRALVESVAAEERREKDVSGAGTEQQSDDDTLRLDVPDAIWPSDNELGIPTLDLRMQATAFDLPCERWGRQARSSRMPGTYHFYTDDYKFDALWSDPMPVVLSGCVNAVEPNYSTNLQMPRAVAVWGIYRKRWLARYWQSQGVRCFVDLNVEPQFDDLNALGIPAGWTAFATRGYERHVDDTDRHYATACRIAGDATPLFLVFSTSAAVNEHCRERGYLFVQQEAHQIEGRHG
jgi:hypothetical protein